MKIYLGADHRGFNLKEELKTWLMEDKFEVKDEGAYSYDPADDYPVFAEKVARSVSNNLEEGGQARGIVICGSGVGVDIVANKFSGIRSGLAVNSEQVKKTREDDDINTLAIPADYMRGEEVKEIIKVFLETQFVSSKKHKRRIEEIRKIEESQK